MADAPGTSTAAAVAALGDNNRAIRKAIRNGDMETFLELLHQPDVDLNYRPVGALLTAIIKNGDSRMAKHLIKADCDVNLKSGGNYSPLLLAILERNPLEITLVEMLLQKGADPNGIYPHLTNTGTPLSYAIYIDRGPSINLEVTSMLLYYGADVNISHCHNTTALQLAVRCWKNSCAEVLLNYYDDYSSRSSGFTVLEDAIEMGSPLVPALVERGADINALDAYGNCVLDLTLRKRNMEMFKCIWSRMNHQVLLKTHEPFLLNYIQACRFANCEYLECLDLILESPIAHYLIEHCIDYLENKRQRYYISSVVRKLLLQFIDRKILPKDTLSTIYTCLSFGIKIETGDLLFVIRNYGFSGEFKALLYAGDFNCCDCIEQIKYFKQWKEDFYLKGFSSFSFENKQHAETVNELLATSAQLKSKTILEALRKVPKFPSLLELSRNEAQKFIEQEFSVTKLYQFYDAVACLKLPQSMKDVILLEKPIYDAVTIIK